MNILQLKDQFRAMRARRGAGQVSPSVESVTQTQFPEAQIVSIEKHTYVLGLEWRFFNDRKDLNQGLRLARREGATHYVVTQSEDLYGLARLHESKRAKRPVSASLQLSQVLSRGGTELFVFQLEGDTFCLVALNDSRPITGFEKVGPRSEILALAGEFQLSQVGNTIRQVGNTGVLEHEETVSLSEAFGKLEEFTGIKNIPNYKLIFLTLGGLLLLGLAAFMVYGYFNEAKLKAEMQRQARERDPNFIYEGGIDAGMKAIGLPAQVQLQRWRDTIMHIALAKEGWTLTGIECLPEECKLNWKRAYGSYADFFAASYANEVRSIETQDPVNPAKSDIQSVLKVAPAQAALTGLVRDKLQVLQQLQRPLASQLQDFSLLSGSTVQLKNPELYPGTPGITAAQIGKPVLRGEWSLSHELWSLNDLSFPLPALTLNNLSITRSQESDQWTYTLKGFYYAKGKDF